MKIVLFGYTGVYMQKISTILIDMYVVIIEESKGKFLPYTYNYFKETEHERLTK